MRACNCHTTMCVGAGAFSAIELLKDGVGGCDQGPDSWPDATLVMTTVIYACFPILYRHSL